MQNLQKSCFKTIGFQLQLDLKGLFNLQTISLTVNSFKIQMEQPAAGTYGVTQLRLDEV